MFLFGKSSVSDKQKINITEDVAPLLFLSHLAVSVWKMAILRRIGFFRLHIYFNYQPRE